VPSGETPIRRRRADRPKLRRWPSEFDADCGEASIRGAQKSDRGFAFIPVLRIHQNYLLAEGDSIFQHQKPTVSVDRYGEGFLAKRTVVRSLAANHERHVENQTLAASQDGRRN